jgi:polysaccharide biosynthesis/export protein
MMIYKSLKKTLVAVLLVCLVGCGTVHQEGVPDGLKFAELPPKSHGMPEYRIHPGDQLDIKFFYNPELNVAIPVRPDGKIALSLIGEVEAAGFQPSELVAELKKRYTRELRNPEITVIVKSFSVQQVFVDGEVEHPGQIELLSGLSTWQAIIKAGGFKNTAARDSVIVIRHGDHNQPIPYRIDLKSNSLDQDSASFQLQPFDVVFVPKTWIAEADKFVAQYVQDLLLFKGWYFNLNPIPSGFTN